MSSTDFSIRSSRQNAYGPQDDRALSEQEFAMVQRLFSDPFSFPLAFKSWLISYLETSDMTLPMSSVSGLQKTLGITGAGSGTLGIFPAGLILPFGGDSAPTGSLLCDGTGYPTATESRLFGAIGYRYGGSGATFNVPDLRERIPVGKGTHPDHDTVGKNENLALGQRRVRHKHVVEGWDQTWITAGTDASVVGSGPAIPGGADVGNHDHAPPDGLPAPTDGPAFLTINFIIVK